MKPFETIKKTLDAVSEIEEAADVVTAATELIDALDRDLTLEEYPWEDDEKIVELTDKLETELNEFLAEGEDDEEEDATEDDDDEDEDEDDEFEGIDEDEEEEEAT